MQKRKLLGRIVKYREEEQAQKLSHEQIIAFDKNYSGTNERYSLEDESVTHKENVKQVATEEIKVL